MGRCARKVIGEQVNSRAQGRRRAGGCAATRWEMIIHRRGRRGPQRMGGGMLGSDERPAVSPDARLLPHRDFGIHAFPIRDSCHIGISASMPQRGRGREHGKALSGQAMDCQITAEVYQARPRGAVGIAAVAWRALRDFVATKPARQGSKATVKSMSGPTPPRASPGRGHLAVRGGIPLATWAVSETACPRPSWVQPPHTFRQAPLQVA